jgi:competence protein ComEC
LEYLKRVAADENGVVTLDFILPTHYHYDHAGGFPLLLADPAVRVEMVYLRALRTGNQKDYEVERWQIGEIRRRIAAAALARGFALEEDLPAQPFTLGGMTLQFFNLDSYDDPRCKGENDNSVVTLVAFGEARALLMGDITASRGLEKELGSLVGRADLLKLSHHGYSMSTTIPFLRAVRPKVAVVTNGLGQVYPNVRWNLTLFARCPLVSGAHENGLIVSLFSDGELKLTGNLHL